ncbi:MAG: ATP-binding protein [Myxococcales bacterium]
MSSPNQGPPSSSPPDPSLPTLCRDACRVPVEAVALHIEPSLLAETPRESSGLFELVPAIARRAIDLGLSAREPCFHVFVAAEPEVMIEEDVVRYAQRFPRPTPGDIVYVHDFDHPEAPRPLVLPPAMGPALVDAMKGLLERLREEVPEITEHDEVKSAHTHLTGELEAKQRAIMGELESTAKTFGFGVRAIHGGVQTFPVLHGKPVSPEQFEVLDASTRRALEEAEQRLTREVEKAALHVRTQTSSFEAARETALGLAAQRVIDRAIEDLLAPLAHGSEVVAAYLERVREALVEDWEDLAEPEPPAPNMPNERDDGDSRDQDPELATRLRRFAINLLVTHDKDAAAPVVYDTNPTYPSLFGYLERRARFGALVTDFTRIRAGSLHKASGGVLVVRAVDLLTDPIIWERMKRVLRERRIGAEDPLGPLGLYATSLRPVPVPIQVRVVLVGRPELYAALLDADPDFAALFRIKVEIDPSIPRTPETMEALDAYLMAMAQERSWGPFDRAARARLLDLATRLSGERDRLSLFLSPLEEAAAFAGATAEARGTEDHVVTAADLDHVWRERRDRAGSVERHFREITLRGDVALDTTGARVGVVNGLSVFSAGDVEFGQPMRITAVVGIGREGLVDVEREAQLGGAIHTKGVAILRGYLTRMFGQERPLSLRAQIAFEQSYGEIDGDSASSSELFAVLSALADVPMDQGLAVTGSVNQLGELQAIGGVAAKIEGFFDLCVARGLTSKQGVLFPKANLPHLVLREDVVLAIGEGRFHLYAVQTAAEGIEVLTGLPAGERDAMGRFPAVSVFGRVERRIIEIAERLRAAEAQAFHDGDGLDDARPEGTTDNMARRLRRR